MLARIHRGDLRLVSRDTPEPSAFAHEILNARPYAFLDDAPLEERRAHAVQTRRAAGIDGESVLDADAIERVRDEERPDPRDADELHDVLLTTGYLIEHEVDAVQASELAAAHRVTRLTLTRAGASPLLVAAERLPELLAIHPDAVLDPPITPPAARAARAWTPATALVELLRGRLTIAGPITAAALAAPLGVPDATVDEALLSLESEGVVLRGVFTPTPPGRSGAKAVPILEWCDRRLLARIHRYTLNRLRAEIAAVTPADFMRFLFAWQHVEPAHHLSGLDGLRALLAQLDGVELPARAWEAHVLTSRLDRYDAAHLDLLCLTGEVGWARLSSGPTQMVGATPIALFLRDHATDWLALRASTPSTGDGDARSDAARSVLECLRTRGASFAHELPGICRLTEEQARTGLAELVAAGQVSSDGVAGLRMLVGTGGPPSSARRRPDTSGRWFAIERPTAEEGRGAAVETIAWVLLRRYGVVCRRLLTREACRVTWRELAQVYRRLEARGEIRGGRFVSGMSGEQFALPDAVERLRDVRRGAADGRLLTISAADPLNLHGIVTAGERIRAIAGNRVVYRNGVAVATLEGDMLKMLTEVDAAIAPDVAAAAAGRRVPVLSGYVGRLG